MSAERIPAGQPLRIGDKIILNFQDVFETHDAVGAEGPQLLASAHFGHTGCGLIPEEGVNADLFGLTIFEIHAANTYGANKAHRLLLKEKAAQQAYSTGDKGPKKFWSKRGADPAGGTRKQRKKKRAGRMKVEEKREKVDEDFEEWDDDFSMEAESGDRASKDGRESKGGTFGDEDDFGEHSKIDPTPRGSLKDSPREENALLSGGSSGDLATGGGGPLGGHDPNDDLTHQETEIYYNDLLKKAMADIEDERRKNNESHLAKRGELVLYGKTVIQLRHVKTGKYVTTVPKLLGPSEKNANTVCLDTDGNSNSHIVIFPLYGARNDTEVVGSEDYAKLCFYKSLRRAPRLYLHSSIPQAPKPLSTRGGKDKGKDEEGEKIAVVKTREVNASFQETCWTLTLYEMFVPEGDDYVRYGDALYMQQLETGNYLAYEENIPLPPGYTHKDPIDERRLFLNVTTPSAAVYCGGDEVASKEPKSNSLFAFEGATVLTGGRINVKAPVRLRHIPSGLYLMIQKRKESLFTADIEGSPDFDAAESFGVVLTSDRESDQTKFWVRKAEPADLPGKPRVDPRYQKWDNRFRLQHFFKELWMKTLDKELIPEEPTVMQRLVKDSFAISCGRELPDFGRKLRMIDCTDDYSYRDTFKPRRVDIGEMRAFDAITSSIKRLEEFAEMLGVMKAEQLLNVAQSNQIEHVLVLLLKLCTKQDQSTSEFDPLTNDADPIPVVQDMFREFGVSDKILDMLGARFLPVGTKKLTDAATDPFLLRCCHLSYRLLHVIAKKHLVNGVALSMRIGFMMTQLGNDFHIADTLVSIFANNRTLLEKVNQEHVEAFIGLLRTRGKLPRYVDFLKTVCTCDGIGIRTNQRMVANQLLRSQDVLYSLKYDPKVGVLVSDPAYQGGQHWVPLYEFCYEPHVINPGGRDHYAFLKGQFELFIAIGTGRSIDSNQIITRDLHHSCDYQMLLAALGDRDLPDEFAILLCEVLDVLYINIDPYSSVKAQSTLRAWVDMRSMKPGQEGQFEDLRHMIMLFVKENYCLDPRRVERNKLFISIMHLAMRLVDFGFYYASKDCFLAMLPHIFPLLDSRSDILPEKAEEQAVVLLEGYHSLEEYQSMAKSLPHDTWLKEKKGTAPEILEIKSLALKFIEQYYNQRLDFQFTRLSQFFQKTLSSSRDSMKGVLANGLELPAELELPMEKELIPDILKDVSMHDHMAIKTIATSILSNLYMSFSHVRRNFGKAEFIVAPQASEYYRRVCDNIVVLNTCSQRAISYKMTSGLELADEVEIRNTLTSILETIPIESISVTEIQRMWLLAGLQTAVCKCLKLSYNVRTRDGEEHDRKEIFQIAYQILIKFCFENPRNQEAMVPHFDLIFSQCELRIGAADVTIEAIRDNLNTCTQIREDHIRGWIKQIVQHGQYPTYLRCMFAAAMVHGQPVKQNQLMLLRLLLEKCEAVIELYNGYDGYEKLMALMRSRDDQLKPEGPLNYHILLVKLLGNLCVGKNHLNKKKVAAILPLDDIIRVLKNIHTYHVVKRPFVYVLDNVYIDTYPVMTDEVALGMVSLLHEYCGVLQAVMAHDPKVRNRYTDPGRVKSSDGTLELQAYAFETCLPLLTHYFQRCPRKCMPANELTSNMAQAVSEMYYVTPDKPRRALVVACIKVMKDVCQNASLSAMPVPGEVDKETLDDPEHLPDDDEESDEESEDVGVSTSSIHAAGLGSTNRFESTQTFVDPNLVTMVVMGAQGDKEEDVPVSQVHKNFCEKLLAHKNTNISIRQNGKILSQVLAFKDTAKIGGYENPYVNHMIDSLCNSTDFQYHALFLQCLQKCIQDEKKATKAVLMANFSTNNVPIVIFNNVVDPAKTLEVHRLSVQLGLTVFDGGNRQAQDTIVNHIKADGGHKFACDMHDYLSHAITSLEFRKYVLRISEGGEVLGTSGTNEDSIVGVDFVPKNMHPSMVWDDQHTKHILQFIKYLVVGHNQFMQDFMREQSPKEGHRDVNILEDLIAYMVAFEHHINAQNVELLSTVIAALTSIAEGPCRRNQAVIHASEVCSMCFRLIDNPPELEELPLLDFNIELVKLLYSLVEGMSDDVSAGKAISYSFNWLNVRIKLKHLYEVVDDDDDPELTSLSLKLGRQYALLIFALEDQHCLSKPITELLDGALMEYAFFSQAISCLEVVQADVLERVYFHVPVEAQYFTHDAREELLWEFDRLPSKRVQGFFELCMKRREEINHRAIINNEDMLFGRIFSVPYKYYEHIKYVQLSLNLFIMFVMLSNGWADVPIQPVEKEVLPDPELDDISMLWVVLLGTMLLITSGLQWVMYIVIHLPLVWIEQFAMRGITLTIEQVQVFDRQKKERVSTLRFIVRKGGKLQPKNWQFYCWLVLYSLRDQLFLWFTAYVLICNMAYANTFFYTVLLLDILTWCKPIKQALLAVNSRLYRLGMLLILYIFTLLIFATYAYYYYRDDIHADSGAVVCDVLWNCFFVILHKSLLKQGTEYVGGDYEVDKDNNQERIVIGTLFYVFFGVMFLCNFLGEIITSYIELSKDRDSKLLHMETTCFICGLNRDDFDWNHKAFSEHVKHEHNMWNYLYFLLHIGTKRDAELSGQEAYIRRMVRTGDIGFFPFQQTLGMNQHKPPKDLALQPAAGFGGGGGGGGGGGDESGNNDMLETGLAVKRQTTVLENIKSAVDNRGDMMIGVSRAIEVELRGLTNTLKDELQRLKGQLDMSATTDAQRIERQLQEMEDKVTNRLDRVVVVVGRATRGSTED